MHRDQTATRGPRRWARALFKERVGTALFLMVGLGALISLAAPALAARGHHLAAKLLIVAFVALLVVYLVGYVVFSILKS